MPSPPLQVARERLFEDLADRASLARGLDARTTEERFVEHRTDFPTHFEMVSRDQDAVKITCLPHPLVLDSPTANNI